MIVYLLLEVILHVILILLQVQVGEKQQVVSVETVLLQVADNLQYLTVVLVQLLVVVSIIAVAHHRAPIPEYSLHREAAVARALTVEHLIVAVIILTRLHPEATAIVAVVPTLHHPEAAVAVVAL